MPAPKDLSQGYTVELSVYPDESSEPHVYRLKGDHVESVAVELGMQTKDKAEIISGVNDGDTVIVNGGYGLADKAKVHIHP